MSLKKRKRHGQPPSATQLQQLIHNANVHYQRGAFRQAAQCLDKILPWTSNAPEILHFRGLVACRLEKFAMGIEFLNRALAHSPNHPEILVTLGNAHQGTGQPKVAEAYYRRALASGANNPEIHFNIGEIQREKGNEEAALHAYQSALSADPNFVLARHHFGTTLAKLGRQWEATEQLFQTVQQHPDYAPAYVSLGDLLVTEGHAEKAVWAYRKALDGGTESLELSIKLASALTEAGDFDEADELLAQILLREPDNIPAQIASAKLCQALGIHAKVIDLSRRVLQMAPSNTDAVGLLADAKKYTVDDNDLQLLEQLLNGQSDSLANHRVHFALGKVYNDLGNYEHAFSHYLSANTLRRKELDYDPKQHRERIDQLIQIFDSNLIQAKSILGNRSERPIFIVGMPRSGTTLTETILAAHHQVKPFGERADIGRMTGAIGPYTGSELPYPDSMHGLTVEVADSFSSIYLQETGDNPQISRITDKMPQNFLHLGLIAILFPKARIIHCGRDPMDNCLSVYFQNFGDGHPYSFDLKELGLYYREYERIMAHWKESIPNPIFDLSYEAMVATPEQTSRDLIAFCGLPWDDACLSFHEAKRTVQTASHWQVRQPVYSSSMKRWLRYEAFLAPLKEGLGLAG